MGCVQNRTKRDSLHGTKQQLINSWMCHTRHWAKAQGAPASHDIQRQQGSYCVSLHGRWLSTTVFACVCMSLGRQFVHFVNLCGFSGFMDSCLQESRAFVWPPKGGVIWPPHAIFDFIALLCEHCLFGVCPMWFLCWFLFFKPPPPPHDSLSSCVCSNMNITDINVCVYIR